MTEKIKIEKTITVEELLENLPEAVNYLSDKGIRCFVCGEPVWGTLEEVSKDAGYQDADIDGIVAELNEMANNPK